MGGKNATEEVPKIEEKEPEAVPEPEPATDDFGWGSTITGKKDKKGRRARLLLTNQSVSQSKNLTQFPNLNLKSKNLLVGEHRGALVEAKRIRGQKTSLKPRNQRLSPNQRPLWKMIVGGDRSPLAKRTRRGRREPRQSSKSCQRLRSLLRNPSQRLRTMDGGHSLWAAKKRGRRVRTNLPKLSQPLSLNLNPLWKTVVGDLGWEKRPRAKRAKRNPKLSLFRNLSLNLNLSLMIADGDSDYLRRTRKRKVPRPKKCLPRLPQSLKKKRMTMTGRIGARSRPLRAKAKVQRPKKLRSQCEHQRHHLPFLKSRMVTTTLDGDHRRR